MGQVAPDYTITTTTNSADWVPLTSPTVLNSGTTVDGSNGYNVTLPSTFSIGGVSYPKIQITDRGWLSFYLTTPLGLVVSTPLNNSGATLPVISAFGGPVDYAGTGSGTSISYGSVGSEFVVQWLGMEYSASPYTSSISFQIRLNLTTNAIKLVYGGTITPHPGTATVQVGIRPGTTGAPVINTDVINLTNNTTFCNWGDAQNGTATNSSLPFSSTTNPNVVPVVGLTYAFTPQTTAPKQDPVTALATANVNQTCVGLSWTAPTVAPSTYSVRYRVTPTSTGTCSNAWTTVSGISGTNTTISGLTASTAYQYEVMAVGSSNSSRWSQIGTFTTAAASTACPVPAGISGTVNSVTSSFTINWSPACPTPSGGYDWKIVLNGAGSGGTCQQTNGGVYGTTGFSNTTSTTFTTTGLSVGVSYDIYVRSNCGGTQSTWVAAFTNQAITPLVSASMYAFRPITTSGDSPSVQWESVTGSTGFATGAALLTGTPVLVSLGTNLPFQGGSFPYAVLDAKGGGISFRNIVGATSTSLLTAQVNVDAGAIVALGGANTVTPVDAGLNTNSTCLYAFVNNKHVFEWKNVKRQTGEAISFQIQVNATTGLVDIVYQGITTAAAALTSTVGIRTYATSPVWPTNISPITRVSPAVTSTNCVWSNAISAASSSGTLSWGAGFSGPVTSGALEVFRFTPQTFNTSTASLTIAPNTPSLSSSTQNTATLTFTATPNAVGFNARVRTPGSCAWTTVPAVLNSTTSVTISGLRAGAVYEAKLQATGTALASSNASNWSAVSSAFTTTQVAKGQNFDYAVSSTGSYTDITGSSGAVVLASTVGSANTTILPQVDISANPFKFAGATITTLTPSINGYVMIGAGGNTGTNLLPFSTSGIYTNGAVSGWAVSTGLALPTAGSPANNNVQYWWSGTEHIFQYKGMATGIAGTENYNFQVRFKPSDSTATVVYGSMTGISATNIAPAIGIRTSSAFSPGTADVTLLTTSTNYTTQCGSNFWNSTYTSLITSGLTTTLAPWVNTNTNCAISAGLTIKFSPQAAWSTVVNPVTAGFTVVSTTATTATLTWTAPTNATLYDVQVRPYALGANCQWTTAATGLTSATAQTITGLTANTNYEWRVRARRATPSAQQAPWSVAQFGTLFTSSPISTFNHTHTVSTGITYTALPAPTALAGFNASPIALVNVDLAAASIPSVYFQGATYSSFYVDENGAVIFGASSAPTGNTAVMGASYTSPTIQGVIVGMGIDLINSTNASGGAAAPGISYQYLSGSNEVVVQFKDAARTGNAATDKFNFQIRIPTLSTGTVKILYGPTVFTTAGSNVAIGLRGRDVSISDYQYNLTNQPNTSNCDWAVLPEVTTSTTAKMVFSLTGPIGPTNGLQYTFTPQPTSPGPLVNPVIFGSSSNINGSSFRAGWTAATNATSYNLQYRAANTCSWTTTLSSLSTNTASVTGLTPATAYEYRIQSVGANNTARYSSISTVTTSATLLKPSNYQFDIDSTVANYVDFTTGTLVTGLTTAANWDDIVPATVNMPSNFKFNGTSYSIVYVSPNGFVSFASPATSTQYSPLSATASGVNTISAFGANLTNSRVTASIGSVSYGTDAGTSEFVIQYKDVARTAVNTTERFSFQIRLRPDDGGANANRIRIVYGPGTQGAIAGGGAATVQVGISNNPSSSTWPDNVNSLVLNATCSCWSRAVSGAVVGGTLSWTTTTPGPTIGLQYTFTPQSTTTPIDPITIASVTVVPNNTTTLTFAAPVSATQYNVQYRDVNLGCLKVWNNMWTTITNASYSTAGANVTISLAGLTSGTTYQYRIQAYQPSVNTARYSDIGTFTVAYSLPFAENFESLSTVGIAQAPIPTAWTNSGANSWVSDNSSFYSRSGSKYLRSNSNAGIIWLPATLLSASQLPTVSFALRGKAVTAGDVTIYVNTYVNGKTTTGAASYTVTSPLSPLNASGYRRVGVNLPSLAAGDGVYYIGIAFGGATSGNLIIDDMTVEVNQAGGLPTITSVTPSNTSASLAFTYDGTNAPNGYEVQYKRADAITWTAAGTAGSSPFSLPSTLTPNANYEVQLRGINGAIKSSWASLAFTTTNTAGVTLPYVENLDFNGTLIANEAVSNTTVAAPTYASVSTLPNGFTTNLSGGTLTAAVLNTSGVSSTGGLTLTTSASPQDVWVFLPAASLAAATQYRLRFNAFLTGANTTLNGGYVIQTAYGNAATPAAMTNAVVTHGNTVSFLPTGLGANTGSANRAYYENIFTTPGAAGAYYVGFRIQNLGANSLVLDDISLKAFTGCKEPSLLVYTPNSTTGALIAYSAPLSGTPLGYAYKVVAGGSTYSAASLASGTSGTTSVQLSSLTSGTSYTFWVRSYCGNTTSPTDSSEWVGTTFTFTSPLAYNIAKSSVAFSSIIPSGTNFASFTSSAPASLGVGDEGYSSLENIGFSFPYHGQTFTNFSVTPNGELYLGTQQTNAAGSYNKSSPAISTKPNVLFPFYDDLVCINGSLTTTSAQVQNYIKYQLTGVTPNQVLTVEWSNMLKYRGSSGFGLLNFQTKLYENGTIEYHYGQMQAFDFVNAANVTFLPLIGMTGKTVSATPTAGQAIAKQFATQDAWGHYGLGVYNYISPNFIPSFPACNDKYTFTPGTTNTYPSADTTSPANDDLANATVLPAQSSQPTNLCNFTFTSKYAKPSASNPTLLADNATNGYADDDVWFVFQALNANTTIKMVGAGGYIPAFQIYNGTVGPNTITSVLGTAQVGSTVAPDNKSVSISLNSLNPGSYYFIRAYHYYGNPPASGSGRATATATISAGGAITGVTLNTGGAGYNYLTDVNSVNVVVSPEVRLFGGGGKGALIRATAAGGSVTSFSVVDGGEGYSSAPTVVIDRPGFPFSGVFGLYVFSTPTPPANDNLKGAVAITPSSTNSCTPLANQLAYFSSNYSGKSAPTCVNTGVTAVNDVWYYFTATSSAAGLVVTPTSMDAAIEVFDAGVVAGAPGTDTTAMTSLVCRNANAANVAEQFAFGTVVGRRYYIRVYAPDGNDGGILGRFSICAYTPGQLAYLVSQSNSGTFTPLASTGATLTPFLTLASFIGETATITLSSPITIGGRTYSTASATTNGTLVFGPTALSGGNTTPLSSPMGEFTIAGYGASLIASTTTPSSNYAFLSASNEHVFEWRNVGFNNGANTTTTQRFSFQIRINSVTNAISLVYDSAARGANYGSPQVGLVGEAPATPYYISNRTGTPTWSRSSTGPATTSVLTTNSTAGNFPYGGMTFTYTPTAIAGYPIFTGVATPSTPTAFDALLKWRKQPEATSGHIIRYRKYTDLISASTYTSPVSIGTGAADSSYTLTGLTANTQYVFEVAARNGAGQSNFGPAGIFTTLQAPYDLSISALTIPATIGNPTCLGTNLPFNFSITNQGITDIPAGSTFVPAVQVWDALANTLVTTVTGSPVTLASTLLANGAATLPVNSLAYTPTLAGRYKFRAIVSSLSVGDPTTSNDSSAYTGTYYLQTTVNSTGYAQGFNGVAGFTNWLAFKTGTSTFNVLTFSTTHTFTSPGNTLAPKEGARLLSWPTRTIPTSNTQILYSECITIDDGCQLLKYNLAQNNQYPGNIDFVEIGVSTDGGVTYVVQNQVDSIGRVTYTQVGNYNSLAPLNGRWNTLTTDLGAFVGQTVRLRIRLISGQGNNLAIDNLRITTKPSADVGSVTFITPDPSTACASANAPVVVQVKNFGCDPQSNFDIAVSITTPTGNVVLNDTYTGTLAPGASGTISLGTVDMSTLGTYVFSSTTQLIGDGESSNDTYGPYTINVLASNLPPVSTASITPNAVVTGTSVTLTGTLPAVGLVQYTDPIGGAIPDNSTTGVTTSVVVPGSVTGTAASVVSVALNIVHTFTGDVNITLIAPNASSIVLRTFDGAPGINFTNTVFTSTASTSITAGTAPFTGTFLPANPFSGLTGNAAGTWQLKVTDNFQNDIGNLVNWTITFNGTSTTSWTADPTNPAVVGSFPYSNGNPGALTFNTPGLYKFTYTDASGGGCANVIPLQLIVSDGNLWTGTVDSGWTTAGNWTFSPAPPNPGTAVTIPTGTPNSPKITSSVSTANLTLGAGQVIVLGTGGSLTVSGNVIGNSAKIRGKNYLNFTGTGGQTLSGQVTVDSILNSNTSSAGVTFAAGADVRLNPNGTLKLAANTKLTIPGTASLTLLSSAAGTARLATVPASAQLIGNLTLQRYFAYSGWTFLAAPFRTNALSTWSGFPARVQPKNNSNIFEYTEPDTTRGSYNGALTEVNGWKVPSSLANPINPTSPSFIPKGYRAYVNSALLANGPLRVAGAPTIGSVSFPYTKTAVGYQGGGWNLVGNPYPSEIDWQKLKTDAAAGNSGTNIGDYFQIWNSSLGAYSSYSISSGTGTNGGSRYIASSQAFFIRANVASGNLNFRETHKAVRTGNSYLRTQFDDNTLRMTLADGVHTDQAIIAFRDFGSNGRDPYDADKLDGIYLNVSSSPAPTLDLVNNIMAPLTTDIYIPLKVQTLSKGTHTLSFEGIESFPMGSTLVLKDLLLNIETDLTQTPLYTFTVSADPATQGTSRFILYSSPQSVTHVQSAIKPSLSVWPNPADGSVSELNVALRHMGNGQADIILIDALGRSVATQLAYLKEGEGATKLRISSLPAGVYQLKVRSGKTTTVQEVVIK